MDELGVNRHWGRLGDIKVKGRYKGVKGALISYLRCRSRPCFVWSFVSTAAVCHASVVTSCRCGCRDYLCMAYEFVMEAAETQEAHKHR